MTVIQTMIQTDVRHGTDIWGCQLAFREIVRDTARDVNELDKHIYIPTYRWADREADR